VNVRAAVVDFDDNRAAVVQVRHLRVRGQRERAVRGGGGDGVEDLAAGGLTAYMVVPRSFPEPTISATRTGPHQRSETPSQASARCARCCSTRAADRSSSAPQGKLRDWAGMSASPGVTPMDWVVLSADVSAIAQADVTKHAREIPIVRRICIASYPSC
jgi:hypothetical protein